MYLRSDRTAACERRISEEPSGAGPPPYSSPVDQDKNPPWLNWLFLVLAALVIAVIAVFAWLSSLPGDYF